MRPRARILLILASVVGVAGIIYALSTDSWPGAPVALPLPEDAAPESQQPPKNLGGEVVSIPMHKEATDPVTTIEGTENPIAPNAPLSDEERIRIRSSALAQRLGLLAAGEAALTAVLLEEHTRRASAMAELRLKPDDAEVRARVRGELDAILAWKTKALNDQFGAEHTAEILKRR